MLENMRYWQNGLEIEEKYVTLNTTGLFRVTKPFRGQKITVLDSVVFMGSLEYCTDHSQTTLSFSSCLY